MSVCVGNHFTSAITKTFYVNKIFIFLKIKNIISDEVTVIFSKIVAHLASAFTFIIIVLFEKHLLFKLKLENLYLISYFIGCSITYKLN